MSEKLKPCPACGNDDISLQADCTGANAFCPTCLLSGPYGAQTDRAIALWNAMPRHPHYAAGPIEMPEKMKPCPPPPGSPAAIDAGCLCPVLDNGHGRGYAPGPTGMLYVYNEMCPVHGKADRREELEESCPKK